MMTDLRSTWGRLGWKFDPRARWKGDHSPYAGTGSLEFFTLTAR